MADGWYTVADFAATFGYTASGVRRMVKAGCFQTRTGDSGVLELTSPTIANLPNCAADAVPRLNRQTVAAILKLTPKRIDQLTEEGKLVRHQIARGYRYSVNDVFAYLAAESNTKGAFCRAKMLAWASQRLQAKAALGFGAPSLSDKLQAEMDAVATLPASRQPVEYARLLLRFERGRRSHVAATMRAQP